MSLIRCPECGTWDFILDEKLDHGYCIKSCGAVFTLHDDGRIEVDPGMRVHTYRQLQDMIDAKHMMN